MRVIFKLFGFGDLIYILWDIKVYILVVISITIIIEKHLLKKPFNLGVFPHIILEQMEGKMNIQIEFSKHQIKQISNQILHYWSKERGFYKPTIKGLKKIEQNIISNVLAELPSEARRMLKEEYDKYIGDMIFSLIERIKSLEAIAKKGLLKC